MYPSHPVQIYYHLQFQYSFNIDVEHLNNYMHEYNFFV